MHYPGYHAEFSGGFYLGTSQQGWKSDDSVQCRVIPDSSLQITIAADEPGALIWMEQTCKSDFQLEYEISFSDSSGMHVLYVCAKDLKPSEIEEDTTIQVGTYKYYAETMRGYQVAVHCYDQAFEHHDHSRMRKNPGQLLFSNADQDPCEYHESYLIDFIKTGNRLQFFVDEERIHDVRDKGIFYPIYTDGKVGLWFEGTGIAYTVILRKVNLFSLSPQ